MNFTKRNNFIEVISLKTWQGTEGQKHYKNLISSGLYQTQVMLNSAFSEFKDEFQENEILDKMDFVIERLNYDITGIIKDLEGYLENEKQFYTSNSKESSLEVDKKNQNLSFIKEIVLIQHQLAQKALEYINLNRSISESSSHSSNIESDKNKGEGTINLKRNPQHEKLVFYGTKKELIIMFLSFQCVGLIESTNRRDLELFLEQNFKYKHGKNIKDVVDVGTEISEIYRPFKEKFDKIKIKQINETKSNIFDKLKNNTKEINFVDENGATPWD
jgi:hypothetical protein